jgi:hypothetical protein
MKIVATIADERNPKGWEECFTATKHDASYVDCRNQVERIVHRFNAGLLPSETPRELLFLRTEEIEEADAFNMGMAAYNHGKDAHENYWPAEHPRHQDWRDGWDEAERMANDDGEDDE